MKRYSIEHIREEFRKKSYILISKEYKNSKRKLRVICPERHEYLTTWSNWKRGRKCPICNRKKMSQLFRLRRNDILKIKKAFKKEKYQLLTDKYINNKQRLEYICPFNHRHYVTWNCWTKGQRCSYCAGVARKDIKFIRSEFIKEGYQLITDNYENNHQKLTYICPEGHKCKTTWNNWSNGHRCPHRARPANRMNLEFIKSEFAKENYQLLTREYLNNVQKLENICPNGHRQGINWASWRNGVRCSICYKKKQTDIAKNYWTRFEYQKKIHKALHRAPNKPEQFLQTLLNHLFPNEYKYVGDFQFFLGGKNPDFMNVNSQKKLIEIFGQFWHSPKMTGVSKKQHELDRIAHFKKFSFDTLILWENELKDENKLVERLQEFHNKEFEH